MRATTIRANVARRRLSSYSFLQPGTLQDTLRIYFGNTQSPTGVQVSQSALK